MTKIEKPFNFSPGMLFKDIEPSDFTHFRQYKDNTIWAQKTVKA